MSTHTPLQQSGKLPSVAVSFLVHGAVLASMAVITIDLLPQGAKLEVDTTFSEERLQQEFSQELEAATEVATSTDNVVAGGTVSTAIGASAPPSVSQVNVEVSDKLEETNIHVDTATVTVVSDDLLGTDLGETEVTGDIGAIVEGYGPALSRMSQELIRVLRKQRVLAVWLFDQSESMRDDQAVIAAEFEKIYQELQIDDGKQDKRRRRKTGADVLLTAVAAFGEQLNYLTPEPTSDLETIRKAMENIEIDESGMENVCQAVSAVIDRYREQVNRQKRKLIVIVVSDESGDDGEFVDDAIAKAQRSNVPIYVMGREAIFGYPFARIRWVDPVYKLGFWRPLRRGPETARVECLQWDGLHRRWDSFSSGFGPYEHVRMARETGGIFFLLPGDESDLTGAGALDKRRFDFLDMKEYRPLLLNRDEYDQAVRQSPFRQTIVQVIERLDPENDPELEIRQNWYPMDPVQFRAEATAQVVRAARAMFLLNQVVPLLEEIAPLRNKESSQRWRASYDLIVAQCLCYRVRLFQYLLAMDRHAHSPPKPEKEDTNRWNLRHAREMIEPDEQQFQRVKGAFQVKLKREEYLQELKAYEEQARQRYAAVIDQHPGTPWARRAQHELSQGFGMNFYEAHRSPHYDREGVEIQVPNF